MIYDKFVDKLVDLLEDHDLRERPGRRARAYVLRLARRRLRDLKDRLARSNRQFFSVRLVYFDKGKTWTVIRCGA